MGSSHNSANSSHTCTPPRGNCVSNPPLPFLYTHLDTHTYWHTHTGTHTPAHTHTHTCTHAHTHTHMHMYTHMHTHTQAHIHTLPFVGEGVLGVVRPFRLLVNHVLILCSVMPSVSPSGPRIIAPLFIASSASLQTRESSSRCSRVGN